MRVKSELNYFKLMSLIEKEVEHICSITAHDPEKDTIILAKQKQNVKTIKFLNKKRDEFSDFFEGGDDRRDLVLRDDLIKLLDNYIIALSPKGDKKKQSSFHLFLSGNLFVTSLYLYGCLNEKDKVAMDKNEKALLKLLERDVRDKGRKNLDDMIAIAIGSNSKREKLYNYLSPIKSKKSTRSIQMDLMPLFDSLKQLKGYRSSLKRTLLESKAVRFKDIETLDKIASYASDSIYYPLLEMITTVRYNYVSSIPSSTIEFTLEGWKLCLLTTTLDGVVERRILASDIRKLQYGERANDR